MLAVLFAKEYGRDYGHWINFETNVGLAQDTSRQFGWVKFIYSGFAPSATSGANVSQPKNLATTFQFKFATGSL